MPLYPLSTSSAAGFTLPLLGPVRRVPYRTPTYAQLFQTGHGWTTNGTGVGSSSLNDTAVFVRGTQSARVTTAGTGATASLRVTGLTAKDLTSKMLRFTFKIDDVAHLNSILVYAGSSGFTNYLNWTLHTHSGSALNFVQSGEWVTATVQWANVQSAAGSYSVSNGIPSSTTGFTDFQFSVIDDAAGAVTFHLQSFEIVPDTAATFPNGVVSITFDDSYQSVYDYARPYMENLGFRGTLYTITDVIGTATYQTLAELKQMQQYSGWEVAGHAYTAAAHNAGYQTLTAAAVRTELRNLKAWLVGNGFPADSFAYPGGRYDATTDGVPVDSICGEFFTTGRSIVSELQESWPPAMEQRMRAKSGISSVGTTVSNLTATGGVLDRCLGDGAWYQICLHKIVTGTASVSTEISQADLQTLMDAIATRGIPVLPVGEVTRYYS